MRGDFHVHTTYSDGKLNIDEVLAFAKTKVDVVAITDHDEVDGSVVAGDKAKEYGLELVYGVEVSSYNRGESVHILGYFKDVNDMLKVRSFLKKQTENRRIRCIVIKELLKEHYNLDLNIDKLLNRSCVTRGSIAQQMLEQGLVSTIKEAFDKYIGENCKAYLPSTHFATVDAIKIIFLS